MTKILIADDDKNIRKGLIEFFSNEGFTVFSAENGSAAYNLAVEHLPDVIITDVHMPVMDGFELMQKLKENPDTSEIPVVIITADYDVRKGNTQKSSGAIACISKPFYFTELLEAINRKG